MPKKKPIAPIKKKRCKEHDYILSHEPNDKWMIACSTNHDTKFKIFIRCEKCGKREQFETTPMTIDILRILITNY
jgi:hypothetical protein